MTEKLQHYGYQFTLLEAMNDGYRKDQQHLYLFNVVAVKVIEHLSNIWGELKRIEKVLEPEGLMVFSTGLANPLIELPDAAKHFKAWWYKNVSTHLIFFCNNTLRVIADMRGYNIDIYGDKLFVVRIGNTTS